MIEAAYRQGEALGLAVWPQDEAGPYQAIPQVGHHWCPRHHARRYPHEHVRGGTVKLLTLFHPASGQVRVRGVSSATNAVLHPWLQNQLQTILETLPLRAESEPARDRRAQWERWQQGLRLKFTLLDQLPPLRMLLIWDNLAGHKTPALVCWLMQHGIMPLYTPLSGSWLNMTESIQRILVGRALAGTQPQDTRQMIQWLETTACAWNRDPTPFIWGGKRHARRERAMARRERASAHNHRVYKRLPGSGARIRLHNP